MIINRSIVFRFRLHESSGVGYIKHRRRHANFPRQHARLCSASGYRFKVRSKYRDWLGIGLVSVTSHSLAILLITSPFAANAASTQFYGVALGRRYSQNSIATPALLSAKGFEGRAFIYATTSTTGSVKKPNSTTLNLIDVG